MGIGCFKEDELAKKKISGKWKYCGDWPEKNSCMCSLCTK